MLTSRIFNWKFGQIAFYVKIYFSNSFTLRFTHLIFGNVSGNIWKICSDSDSVVSPTVFNITAFMVENL